jgi:hypothetical protein
MKDRVDALIKLLFDNDASITERDEAATSLGEFPDIRVIKALLLKAKDLNEDGLVLNSCGESIGIIWAKQNFFDDRGYRALPRIVRYGIYVVIKSRKPEWIEQYQLEMDKF